MTTPQDLYQAADQALLLAKRTGRNRVAVYAEPAR
jgi:PleD family two-component response regulator